MLELVLPLSTVALAVAGLWRYGFRLTLINAVQGVWLLLISLPSAVLFADVGTAAKDRLFISTTIINLALLALVLLQPSRWFRHLTDRLRGGGRGPADPAGGLPRWFWILFSLSLASFLIHAALMPRVPLIELLRSADLTDIDFAQLRQAASKSLPIPHAVKYLFNWNVRVLVPILLTFLLVRGRRHEKVVGIPLLLILSALTLEKSIPAFAILSTAFAVAIYRGDRLVSLSVVLGLVLAFAVAFGMEAAIGLRNAQARVGNVLEMVAWETRGELPGIERGASGRGGKVASVRAYRDLARYVLVVWSRNWFLHRIVQVPSQVAYAWFDYFPEVNGGFEHGRSWLALDRRDPDFRHPAQRVGYHAYYRKHPSNYLPTVSAYGAVHADAWANFGYWGVAGAALLLAVILAAGDIALEVTRSLWNAAAAGTTLAILLITLPSGGLQAALVAQGLIISLAFLVVPIAGRLRRGKRVEG